MGISLRSFLLVPLTVLAGASCFAACSASSGSNGGSGASSSSGGSSAAGGSGTGGGIATGGSGGGVSLGGTTGSGGSGGLQDGSACTGQTTKSNRLPLDMYVMMDISGSMLDKLSNGQTKWAAVEGAMSSFLKDPNSQGLGVGIQYFPLLDPNVPDTCTSNADCGSGGLCVLKTCSQTGGSVVPCSVDADCSANNQGQCVNLGQDCTNPQQLCIPGGKTCMPSGCIQLTTSWCDNQTSCTIGDYAKPAVEIYTLGSPNALVNSMGKQTPNGQTPTGPALHGAINHATTWAKAHPTHTVIVVLATDGIPTQCSPTGINQVAQIAANGVSATPSIDTFVIGVFGPNDTSSQANLNTIAQSGGTGSAFIVDTTGNVGQQFTDALNKIRGQSLACEFAIPDPPDGGTLDYNKVNVSYTSGGTTQNLYYVGDKSKCDPTNGGWYYDDPKAPTKIIVCDKNCADFKATSTTTSQQVDVELGCQTKTQIPR